jgi:hypothetical protein
VADRPMRIFSASSEMSLRRGVSSGTLVPDVDSCLGRKP